MTDPPYGLEFMGKEWDRLWRTDEAAADKRGEGNRTRWLGNGNKTPRYEAGSDAQSWHQQWAAALLRVLKPGGYLLTFGGTRTYHRMACAVEDAGFEIRDCIMWLYAQGFPKAKSCLKPAYEPILLARKPGRGMLPLGIDECRVGTTKRVPGSLSNVTGLVGYGERPGRRGQSLDDDGHNPNIGRWPANVCHDGSDEVMEAFAAFGERPGNSNQRLDALDGGVVNVYGGGFGERSLEGLGRNDTGTAARFFYCAKASKSDRGDGNNHPTVKPTALMEWLVKLVAREGETVLDPFAGSGTTLLACHRTGRKAVGIERDPAYFQIARRRIETESADSLFAGVA